MRVAVLSSALPEVRCAGHDVHLIQECRGDKPLAYVQVWFQKQISHESDARRELPRVSDCVADLRVCLLELGIADLPFSDVLLEGDVLARAAHPLAAVGAVRSSGFVHLHPEVRAVLAVGLLCLWKFRNGKSPAFRAAV